MATKTVVLDPNVRIEGHLRIELETEGDRVVKARSSGTSFRGFENILQGRDPRDAPHITQRICGVCPIPYARASAEAIESARGIAINNQARLLRNLIHAANFIDSHLLHFYMLTMPDFIQGLPTSAAKSTGPLKPWRGGESISVANIADHFAAMLAARRSCHKIGALFGGRMPHGVGIVAGGATAMPTAEDIATAKAALSNLETMVSGPYPEDLHALIDAFPAYKELGAAKCDFLSFGGFPDQNGSPLLKGGLVLAKNLAEVKTAIDETKIQESVAFSRYQRQPPLHPSLGVTVPDLDREDAYSWLKAPRFGQNPCEVGPLARALTGGRDLGYYGVWARHLARQQEALILVKGMNQWLTELEPGKTGCPKYPDAGTHGSGYGLLEAPRGALGHWITIADGKIERYHIVAPTTWNASPRDEAGTPGPMERSLENITLADTHEPIEATRIVHSFDPCLQCAVH